MTGYDDELGDDDYLDEELIDGLEPRTTESGDLLDDSNAENLGSVATAKR